MHMLQTLLIKGEMVPCYIYPPFFLFKDELLVSHLSVSLTGVVDIEQMNPSFVCWCSV